MSIEYQGKLIDLYDESQEETCLFWDGFYIKQSGSLYRVRLIGCAFYYSTSLNMVKRRIAAFRKAFNL